MQTEERQLPKNKIDETMIKITDIHASYQKEEVLHGVSLSIKKGEFMVLIGPSGCGKTTLLKVINGLVIPDKGEVIVDGERLECCNLISLRRQVGYAVQGARLFPHMSVTDNICYVPSLERKMSDKEKTELAEEMMRLVQLPPELGKRFPAQLSGGQQQRAGIARALANHPSILLMDEPFGAVDEITRKGLQEELLSLQEKTGVTIVFITHDIREACKLGSRIAVIKEGKLLQVGTGKELRDSPADNFIQMLLEEV